MTIRDDTHNHEVTLRGAHPVHRKKAMTHEVKQNIAQQSRTQATPATILTSLRLNGDDPEDPLFKSKDIYNARAAIRRRALGPLTPIQALMKFLNQAEYHLQYEKDEADQITRLFFFKESSQQILTVNHLY